MRKENAERIAEIQADLEMPAFPKALGYLWNAYLRMRRRAAVGFNGPQPIGWQDIGAFVRLSGLRLTSWEIGLIEAIDDIYLQPAPTTPTPEGQTVRAAASASDGRGVRSILGAVGKRRRVKRKGG